MSHHFEEISVDLDREAKYKMLLRQIAAVIEDESDLVANLANIAALIKFGLGFFWAGFYIEKQGELVLGPYQGPVACSRIPFGKGVCGTSAQSKETIIVRNVEDFPGHIACSSASKSEIVVPLVKDNRTRLILDIDSEHLAEFTELDAQYLEKIVVLIKDRHFAAT